MGMVRYQKYYYCVFTLSSQTILKAELLAVLTMMVDGIDKKELDKIAEKFIDEIDNSEVRKEKSVFQLF